MAVYKSIVNWNSKILDDSLIFEKFFQNETSVFLLNPKLNPSGLSSSGQSASFRISLTQVEANSLKSVILFSTHGVPLVFNLIAGNPGMENLNAYLKNVGRDYSVDAYISPLPISQNRTITKLNEMINKHPQLKSVRKGDDLIITYNYVGLIKKPKFIDDGTSEVEVLSSGKGSPIERELQWIKSDSPIVSTNYDLSFYKRTIENFGETFTNNQESFSTINKIFNSAFGENAYLTRTYDGKSIFIYFQKDGQKQPVKISNNSIDMLVETIIEGGVTSEPVSMNLNQFETFSSHLIVEPSGRFNNEYWARRGWSVNDDKKFERQLKLAILNNVKSDDPNKDWNVIIVRSKTDSKPYTVVLIYPRNQGTIIP